MLCKYPYGKNHSHPLLLSHDGSHGVHLFMSMSHFNEAQNTESCFSFLISDASVLGDRRQKQVADAKEEKKEEESQIKASEGTQR